MTSEKLSLEIGDLWCLYLALESTYRGGGVLWTVRLSNHQKNQKYFIKSGQDFTSINISTFYLDYVNYSYFWNYGHHIMFLFYLLLFSNITYFLFIYYLLLLCVRDCHWAWRNHNKNQQILSLTSLVLYHF